MLKTEERRVGEHDYRVRQLPGREGLAMFTRLTKLAGPAIGALAKGGDVRSLLDAQVGTLADALGVLCDELDEEKVQAIARDFAKHCQVRTDAASWQPLSNEAVFDDVFAGRVDELLGWLGFCVEVNYRGFLAVGRKLTGRASGAAPAAEK